MFNPISCVEKKEFHTYNFTKVAMQIAFCGAPKSSSRKTTLLSPGQARRFIDLIP